MRRKDVNLGPHVSTMNVHGKISEKEEEVRSHNSREGSQNAREKVCGPFKPWTTECLNSRGLPDGIKKGEEKDDTKKSPIAREGSLIKGRGASANKTHDTFLLGAANKSQSKN